MKNRGVSTLEYIVIAGLIGLVSWVGFQQKPVAATLVECPSQK